MIRVVVCDSFDTCVDVKTFKDLDEVCAYINKHSDEDVTFTLKFEKFNCIINNDERNL